MILQLQPEQITEYWEIIRYAAIVAMGIEPPAHAYAQALLTSLLSGTHQCWIIFGEEHAARAVGITCILQDKLTGRMQLHIDAFYSYQSLDEELAHEAAEYVKQYARASECTQIRALTDNARGARLLELVGFEAGKREYILTCG